MLVWCSRAPRGSSRTARADSHHPAVPGRLQSHVGPSDSGRLVDRPCLRADPRGGCGSRRRAPMTPAGRGRVRCAGIGVIRGRGEAGGHPNAGGGRPPRRFRPSPSSRRAAGGRCPGAPSLQSSRPGRGPGGVRRELRVHRGRSPPSPRRHLPSLGPHVARSDPPPRPQPSLERRVVGKGPPRHRPVRSGSQRIRFIIDGPRPRPSRGGSSCGLTGEFLCRARSAVRGSQRACQYLAPGSIADAPRDRPLD